MPRTSLFPKVEATPHLNFLHKAIRSSVGLGSGYGSFCIFIIRQLQTNFDKDLDQDVRMHITR